MFCVECGKEKQIFRNGVCINCYIKNHSFSNGPTVLDVDMCSKCSSYKYKNIWLQEPFETALKRYITDSFNINNELKKMQIKTDCKEKGKNIACKVKITGYIDDNKITENHFLTARIKRTTCDICSKQYGGYYEAILQIRAERRKPTKEELEIIRLNVETFVENHREKGNRGLYITDIGKVHGGLDFYLSEKGAAFTIAKKIQEKYGGVIKQSSKNLGIKDGQQMYRMTYLIRLPAYRKGDFISHDNSYFYISSLTGDKVHVLELTRWTESVFDGKDLQTARILGGNELIKEMIVVSQSKNDIQVMDPKTYKTIEIRKPRDVLFDSPRVHVVKLEDQVFLSPEKNISSK